MPETATNAPPNKRTRIDPAATLITPTTTTKTPPEKQTPKKLAHAFVRHHVSSLQPEVASLVETFALKQVDTLIKRHQKLTQHTRLTDDESFIPRSARIKFDFYMTPEAQATTAFEELRAATNKTLETVGTQLKSHILAAIKIESDTHQQKANKNFAEALYHVTKAFLVFNNASESVASVNATAKSVLEQHHESLFKHLDTSPASFVALYDITHSTTMTPPAAPSPGVAINPYTGTYAARLSQSLSQSQSQSQSHAPTTQVTPLKPPTPSLPAPTVDTATRQAIARALEATFVASFDEYLDQVHKNKVASQLKAYQTEILAENATLETVQQLDMEDSTTPERLKELIAKEAKKAVTDLERQIQSLTDTISKLNSGTKQKNIQQRGRSQGASTRKKKNSNSRRSTSSNRGRNNRNRSPSPHSQRRPNQRRRNHRADESDNDSDNANSASNSKKRGKSKKRPSDANNRRKKPSNVSSTRR